MPNQFGLARAIPADVKRAVRARCGFGCVICGDAWYQYEHFAPPFALAKSHDPEGIALVCQKHHSKKGTLLSPEEYQERRASPRAIELGAASTKYSLCPTPPEVLIGNAVLRSGTSLIQLDDELVFGFLAGRDHGEPPRFHMRSYAKNGRLQFAIVGNEIICTTAAFDIESSGGLWTVRSKRRKVDLRIRVEPPTRITLERAKLRFGALSFDLSLGDELGFGEREEDDKHVRRIDLIPGEGRDKDGLSLGGPCLFKFQKRGRAVVIDGMTIDSPRVLAPLGSHPLSYGFRILHDVAIRSCSARRLGIQGPMQESEALTVRTRPESWDLLENESVADFAGLLANVKSKVAGAGDFPIVFNPGSLEGEFVWRASDLIDTTESTSNEIRFPAPTTERDPSRFRAAP